MDYLRYLNAFIDEANENVHALNRFLLELEQTSGNPALLNGLFRSAHTLKASSQTMGFQRISRLTHEMENIISAIQDDRIALNSYVFDLLFRIVDCFENFLFHIFEFGNEGGSGYEELLVEIATLNGGGISASRAARGDKTAGAGGADGAAGAAGTVRPAGATGADSKINKADISGDAGNSIRNDIKASSAANDIINYNGAASYASSRAPMPAALLPYNPDERAAIQSALADGRQVYEIKIILVRDCLMKAARAFIIIQMFEKFGEILHSEPNIEDIEDERFGSEFIVTLIAGAHTKSLQGIIAGLSEIEKFEITEIKPDFFYAQSLGEGRITDGADAGTTHIRPRVDWQSDMQNKTVRIGLYQLESLQARVSELSKTVADLIDSLPKPIIKQLASQIARLEEGTACLENVIARINTAPLADIFDRFPRIFAELTKKLGKQARLKISGGETICDIGIVSCLTQPLLHILRNSIDHGIENANERIAKGKPAMGLVIVNACSGNDEIIIEVTDDGAGIDVSKLREKAIKAGAISEARAKTISNDEVLKLVFLPSLSTREQVSMFSGRGVGMDVVKAKVEEMGGTVEIASEEGSGTKIIIRIPYTVSVFDTLLMEASAN